MLLVWKLDNFSQEIKAPLIFRGLDALDSTVDITRKIPTRDLKLFTKKLSSMANIDYYTTAKY